MLQMCSLIGSRKWARNDFSSTEEIQMWSSAHRNSEPIGRDPLTSRHLDLDKASIGAPETLTRMIRMQCSQSNGREAAEIRVIGGILCSEIGPEMIFQAECGFLMLSK
jgi:hypothetical protein